MVRGIVPLQNRVFGFDMNRQHGNLCESNTHRAAAVLRTVTQERFHGSNRFTLVIDRNSPKLFRHSMVLSAAAFLIVSQILIASTQLLAPDQLFGPLHLESL
jgi:hypothetical protein